MKILNTTDDKYIKKTFLNKFHKRGIQGDLEDIEAFNK